MTTNVSTLMNPKSTTSVGVTPTFPKIPARITSTPLESDEQVIPEVLERLSDLGKSLAAIHRVCSEAYCTQGKYADALRHQTVAVDMDHDTPEYRNQRGYLSYLTGDDLNAIQDFTWVVQNEASNAEAHFNLGMVYFGQGQYLEAEVCFTNCTNLVGADAEAWNNLGVARFHLGRIAEAKECFGKAVTIDPAYEDAAVNLRDLTA